MKQEDSRNWNDLLSMIVSETASDGTDLIRVERHGLVQIADDLNRLILATERRYQDTADRLVYEHRERFHNDLIDMNNLRIRLNSILRNAR